MKNRLCLVAAVALAVTAASGGAQSGNQSDVTGVATTGSTIAGGAFTPSPGTVAVPINPQVQAAITQASAAAVSQLSSGTLTSPSGQALAIPAATQQAVTALMSRWSGGTGAAASVAADLSAAGAPAMAAAALVESVGGLLANPAPGQLASAIGNLNALVGAADASFLASPPPSFAVIHAVLVNLVAAANAAAPPAAAGRE